jgi:hypothetical protein
VLAPGRGFRKLATNKLDGRIMASPAISGTAIYLRTDRHLYCIDRSESPAPLEAGRERSGSEL